MFFPTFLGSTHTFKLYIKDRKQEKRDVGGLIILGASKHLILFSGLALPFIHP